MIPRARGLKKGSSQPSIQKTFIFNIDKISVIFSSDKADLK